MNSVMISKHTYMHTYIHAYIHTCIHMYIHTYIHTDIHKYIHTETCAEIGIVLSGGGGTDAIPEGTGMCRLISFPAAIITDDASHNIGENLLISD